MIAINILFIHLGENVLGKIPSEWIMQLLIYNCILLKYRYVENSSVYSFYV